MPPGQQRSLDTTHLTMTLRTGSSSGPRGPQNQVLPPLGPQAGYQPALPGSPASPPPLCTWEHELLSSDEHASTCPPPFARVVPLPRTLFSRCPSPLPACCYAPFPFQCKRLLLWEALLSVPRLGWVPVISDFCSPLSYPYSFCFSVCIVNTCLRVSLAN